MTSHIIEFEGLSIELTRKPIKNMNLRIYPPDGQVRISAPYGLDVDIIHKQLEMKKDWIHQQRKRLQRQRPAAPHPTRLPSSLLHLGKSFELSFQAATGHSRVHLQGQTLLLIGKATLNTQAKQTLIEGWQKEQLQTLLPALIQKWTQLIGVEVKEWRIKKMKTRWGSCNTRAKRIWLSLKLIEKPLICIEYVLVHELIHLLEPSHNKRFYRLMSDYMPEWKAWHELLENKNNF